MFRCEKNLSRSFSGEARKKFTQEPAIKRFFFKTKILNLRIKYIFNPINYNIFRFSP